MDQVEGKYEDGAVILTETVKLLNFTIGAGSRRVSQIFAKLFTKVDYIYVASYKLSGLDFTDYQWFMEYPVCMHACI